MTTVIDRSQLLKKTKQEIIDALLLHFTEIEEKRQVQVQNQVAAINRLMQGATYDEEMARLHEELAAAQSRLIQTEQDLRGLHGQSTPTARNRAHRTGQK